jgi:hypothetical protein
MTNLSLLNNTNSLKITCSSEATGEFNYQNYTMTAIDILAPSLLYYNGQLAPACILISHSTPNGNTLFVIIPINSTQNTVETPASKIVESVISSGSQYAPQQNETTTQGLEPFSIKTLLPELPFMFFENQTNHYICFSLNAAIVISQSSITTLKTIIQPTQPLTFATAVRLFMNPNGPIMKNAKANELYIECQPTDISEETLLVENGKSIFDSISLKQTSVSGSILIAMIGITASIVMISFIYFCFITVRQGVDKKL